MLQRPCFTLIAAMLMVAAVAGCSSFGDLKQFAMMRLRSDTNTAVVSMIGESGLCKCPPFTLVVYENGDAIFIGRKAGAPREAYVRRLWPDSRIVRQWPARIDSLRLLVNRDPCFFSEGEITILYRMNNHQVEVNCCQLGKECDAIVTDILATTGAKELLGR